MLNNKSSIGARFWICAVIAGLFLSVYAAYPQFKLWSAEGEWQGHYAYNDIDEVAYAAYLKALIDGRPRRNDPYSGKDDTASEIQPESLFSIQFAAPYAVALPARALGVSAPLAMILTGVFAGFFAAVICFWLLYEFSGSALFSCAGSLFVLCGGALFAGEGAIGELLGIGFPYPYFPFLRRYLPAVPFPVFLFLLTAVLKMLRAESRRSKVGWCVAASVSFSFLVFSYFYIWTAAAAWLACLTVALIVARPDDWKSKLAGMAALGASCLGPLAVYAYMLSNRASSMDNVQLLVSTHLPDLERTPLFIGLAAIAIAVAIRVFRKNSARSLHFIFTVTTGVVPFLLFNQQVLTGKSLQPIHYEVFIGNYIAGLSLVLAFGMLIKSESGQISAPVKALIAGLLVISVVWGFVECHITVRVLDGANVARDRGMPVGKFLHSESRNLRDPFRDTVVSFSTIQSDDLPTIAPQNVLWARHQHIFAGLTWQENKERFYKHLYYQDLSPEWLENQLKSGNFVASIALFGWGRHSDRLTTKSRPLTYGEIGGEVAKFRAFTNAFDKNEATEPVLSYLTVRTGDDRPFLNLDKWYQRELLHETNGFRIYRLMLR